MPERLFPTWISLELMLVSNSVVPVGGEAHCGALAGDDCGLGATGLDGLFRLWSLFLLRRLGGIFE